MHSEFESLYYYKIVNIESVMWLRAPTELDAIPRTWCFVFIEFDSVLRLKFQKDNWPDDFLYLLYYFAMHLIYRQWRETLFHNQIVFLDFTVC